jgi:beta-galactosidase
VIVLGTQYYRPPFPNEKYWDDDLAKMADSGLNTVQLWVKWAWVEPTPDEFRFDDFDRIVELADKHGLKVVLSTIAAIHPYWIHRVVPDSEMITNEGHRVVSSNRSECHFGLTPGGCFDHPGVWERMKNFLATTTEHFKPASNLFGWDAWNELRWCINADGLVCYCPHTLARFRSWLDEKHGGLDGLNHAWQRRYACWDDVMPGKAARSPYTEMMAFQDFISWRSVRHATDRYRVMKAIDPDRPVTVHGHQPTALINSGGSATSLHRGNDWGFADLVDGIGTSSFPHWQGIDLAAYIGRIAYSASARRGKRLWLSEVQGGRSAMGFSVHTPVPPPDQQRWIWVGVALGAEAVLFWCWRDEVFGRESAGFGLDGNDGHRAERLREMARTGRLLAEHDELLSAYEPDRADAGVYFSPQTYYLHWTEEGRDSRAVQAARGYARALVRSNIPFRLVEEEHLDELDGLRVLFLPRTLVVDDGQAAKLAEFVRNGGTLVCESECGAFASNGIYRYPEDRFLPELTGIREIGRRSLTGDSISCRVGGETLELRVAQWLTPFDPGDGEVRAESDVGPVVVSEGVGSGRVMLCGAYLGEVYDAATNGKEPAAPAVELSFERFVRTLARQAGAEPLCTVEADRDEAALPVFLAAGRSGDKRLLFVFSEDGDARTLRVREDLVARGARDLISGGEVSVETGGDGATVHVPASDWGVSVLVS